MSDSEINELDALRIFIEDAIYRADPTLDTSAGSPIDRELITPLLTRLGPDPYATPVVDFIRERLVSEFPDLSVQEGEPISDTVIDPMRVLLEPHRRQIQQISNQQSIANTDLISDEEADNYMANWFERRREGQYVSGLARIYFSAPQAALVTPSNPVFTGTDVRFFPVENQSISADNMLLNVEGNLYYFDIIVRSEDPGSAYSINAGELVGIEGISAAVKVTNKSAFEEADDRETTEEFLERVENGLTEKSLVTTRGIFARLTDTFESLKTIQVIGYGDIEMARDIIKGTSESTTYAAFRGVVSVLGPFDYIDIASYAPTSWLIADGNPAHNDFIDVGLEVGDIVEYFDVDDSSPTFREIFTAEVVEITSQSQIRISQNSPFVGTYTYLLKKPAGKITISDIPGGILEPNTAQGTIEINDDEVHIGGHTDVFVRAGEPPERSITLEGMRDQQPLHFGVDLESYGERDDEYINITDKVTGSAKVASTDRDGNTLGAGSHDQILILVEDTTGPQDTIPWRPASEDIGRYLQILDYGTSNLFGMFEITDVICEELDGTDRVIRIQVSFSNEWDGSTISDLEVTTLYDLDYRLSEYVSFKDQVRDRDNSRAISGRGPGIDFDNLGVDIGDSLVIETGDDAGIYTVRALLDSIDTADTLLLDRELTKTVTPTGFGDGSGLRYRIDDELDIDLVDPRVVKIPLGSIFTGGDLSTIAGSDTVTSTGTSNFLLAGVAVGDTLEILSGTDLRTFGILAVTGTTLQIDAVANNTATGLDFTVYTSFSGIDRPMVRVKEIELLDSSNQPTGLKVPFGDTVDIRALGTFSNRNEGDKVTSFTGEAKEVTGDFRLEDTEVDFAARGVVVGDRLTILNTGNIGDYEVKEVAALAASPSWVKIIPTSEGGKDFSVYPQDSTQYRVGLPSTGIARLYFVEPASVEVTTGIAGGRLEDNNGQEFRFSDFDGKFILPAPGEEDIENPRDVRVVRSSFGALYEETVLELTEPGGPNVFDLELQVGDIFEYYQQIPFRDGSGNTFESLGIFDNTAGLLTTVGSNRVRVTDSSLLDFTQMDAVNPLLGQLLYIDSGPDEGQYIIEEVVDATTLRLDRVMTSTTEAVVGREFSAPSSRDATLSPSASKTWLTDTTDSGSLGTQIGHYITIFEATREDILGTFEITDLDLSNDRVEIDLVVATTIGPGDFSWYRTADDTNTGQAFRVYESVPTALEVNQVSSKESDTIFGTSTGNISLFGGNLVKLTDSTATFVTDGIVQGERLEILFGDNQGVYPIEYVDSETEIRVYVNKPFTVAETGAWYRIRGGIHGSKTMFTVKDYEGVQALVPVGYSMPFRIRRPDVYRLSSTEMESNYDGSLYYADINIESLGAGDEFNLSRDDRLAHTAGVTVDGYLYVVDNNVLTFSTFEEVDLVFDRRFLPVGNSDLAENLVEISGRNLKITYQVSSITATINDLLRSDSDRTVVANPIARHFLPSYVRTTLIYSGGQSQDTVGQEIEDYINNLGSTEELEVSDIEAIATRRGANSVEHPITLVSITHDIDRDLVVDRSDNVIGGTEVNYNGTARISAFFADLDDGLNITRES